MSTTSSPTISPNLDDLDDMLSQIKSFAEKMNVEIAEKQQQLAISPIEVQAQPVSRGLHQSAFDIEQSQETASKFNFDASNVKDTIVDSHYNVATSVEVPYSLPNKVATPNKVSSVATSREIPHIAESHYQTQSIWKYEDYTYSPSPLTQLSKDGGILNQSQPRPEESLQTSTFKDNLQSQNILAEYKPLNDYTNSVSTLPNNVPQTENYIHSTADYAIPNTKQHINEPYTDNFDSAKKDHKYMPFGVTYSSSVATGSTYALSNAGRTPQKDGFGGDYNLNIQKTDSKAQYAVSDYPDSDRKSVDQLSSLTPSPTKITEKKPLYDKSKLDSIIQNISLKRSGEYSAIKSPSVPGPNETYKPEERTITYNPAVSDMKKSASSSYINTNQYGLVDHRSVAQRPHEEYAQIGRDFVQLKIDTEKSSSMKESHTPTPIRPNEINIAQTPSLDQTFKYIWQEIGYVPTKEPISKFRTPDVSQDMNKQRVATSSSNIHIADAYSPVDFSIKHQGPRPEDLMSKYFTPDRSEESLKQRFQTPISNIHIMDTLSPDYREKSFMEEDIQRTVDKNRDILNRGIPKSRRSSKHTDISDQRRASKESIDIRKIEKVTLAKKIESHSSISTPRSEKAMKMEKISDSDYNREFLRCEALKAPKLKVERAYKMSGLTGKLEMAHTSNANDRNREKELQEEKLRLAKFKCRIVNKTEKAIM